MALAPPSHGLRRIRPDLCLERSYTIDMLPRHTQHTQRLRTPDHLPMDFNQDQTRQQAVKQRHQRQTTSHSVLKTCRDSDNLRQYSRRRFEFALQNATSGRDTCKGPEPPRPYTTPIISSKCPAWTGPTKNGSLLYNRVPLMLNTIRVRPQSESARFSHVNRRYNDIDVILRQSNTSYAVRSKPSTPVTSLRSASRGSGYTLVPQPADGGDNVWDGDSEDDLGSEGTAWRSHTQVLPTGQGLTCKDNTNRITPDTFGYTRHPGVKPFCGQTQPRFANNEGYCENRLIVKYRSTGSDQSTSGSLSSASSRSERPKCWVDDVTISSELSETDELMTSSDVRMGEQSKQKVKVESKIEGKTDTKQVKLDVLPSTDADDIVQEQEEDADDMSYVDSEPQFVFPNFMCPSSERKSRQVAIKQWLASTNFTCADRTVPLYW